ncbi:MAG: VWA domain-containing protein [Rhodospirillales bacterium]|nr:VWA domain-containing protein [Rhodospirillales bacterium]
MLMAIAAAGPAWRPAPSPFVTEAAPVVVALDLSQSMARGDIQPSRLERAKQKIHDLIALRAGGRVGLIAYAGSAHLVMPLTNDPTALEPFLEGLDPSIMPAAGQRPSNAARLAERLLANEPQAGSVLFVTDGIDPGDIADFPREGSARAALIVAPDGGGAEIRNWSRQAGIATVTSTLDNSDLDAVQRALASSFARAEAKQGKLQDDGWIMAVPAGLLLLVWFRRGTTLNWAMMALALVLAGPVGARADDLSDLFRTPDQQGQRLYQSHRYAEAADRFTDPSWRAAALFRSGKYMEAAGLLASIRTSTAQYNRGTALVRGRDYRGAKAAFEQALKLDPANAAARHNLDVTEKIIAYLTSVGEAEDQGAQSEPPDATVNDLSGDQGKRQRIDRNAQLSEDAAEQWMRQVQTEPADFLKSRFALENQAAR